MRTLSIIVALTLFYTQNVLAQFSSVVNLTPLTITANTREKPQSKVWIHDNKHWTFLSDAAGAHVWRLDGNSTWTKVLTVSNSSNHRADCKVVGNLVHILLFRDISTDLVSIEYVPANSTYKLWTGRPGTVQVPLDAFSETATIDIDTNGRMWMASDNDSSITVLWSNSPYTNWSTPVEVAPGIAPDDIGAVIAFPAIGKIGVLWSNQITKRFGFKLHTDGTDPALWSADELPASQSALNVGAGMGDDHLNMKLASDGTLYCAVKTSYDTPGYTKISLLVRRPNGTWDNLYGVSEIGTRGIVVLNEQAGKIRIIYASSEDGGDILYKESALSPISFGPQLTLMAGVDYNNPTSIKNTFTGQVVILASSSTSAVGVLATDNGITPFPGIPTLTSPVDYATGITLSPTLSWNAATNASTYQLQIAKSSTFSSPVSDIPNITGNSRLVSGLVYSTQYFWRVRAINSSGGWSAVQRFTTVSAPVPPIPTLTSPANYATGITLTPTLRWNAATNTSTYQLQIAKSSTFSSPVSNITSITGNSRSVSGLKHNTPYYWRVRAINSFGAGGWSAVRRFTTVAAPLPTNPNLVAPANYATGIAISPTLRWNAAANAVTYQVQLSTSFLFTKLVFDKNNITGNSKSVSGLKHNTTYYWRVRAINSSGAGGWSSTRRFTTVAKSSARQSGPVNNPEKEATESSSGNGINTFSLTSGITDSQPEQLELVASPNPFQTASEINFTIPDGGEYSLVLYNMTGQPVRSLKQGFAKTGEKLSVILDGFHLHNGLYLVRLQTDKSSQTLKLIRN